MFALFLFLFSIPTGLFAGLPQHNPTDFQAAALQTLHLEEYISWTPSGSTPMVFSVTSSEHMDVMRADTSGQLWLVQSEPERPVEDWGSDTQPAVVAAALLDVTQPFACCGVVVDPAGLAWLDGYIAAGGLIPDVWHIHIFQQWSGGWIDASMQFERWMAEHDVLRPVIVSEAAAGHAPLYLQDEVMQTAYQQLQSVPWLCAVYWYSVHHSTVVPLWPNADLLTAEGERTPLGNRFVALRDSQGEVTCQLTDSTDVTPDPQEPDPPPSEPQDPPPSEPQDPPPSEPQDPPPSEPQDPPPSEPQDPPPSEPQDPPPSEPENPAPSEPQDPPPSEPQNPPPSEPENPAPGEPENPAPNEPLNPSSSQPLYQPSIPLRDQPPSQPQEQPAFQNETPVQLQNFLFLPTIGGDS